MKAPHEFDRRILLCVTGLSPQVVTETLYALVHSTPQFVPTEVHIATTRTGADSARLNLLSTKPGWFQRLRLDYGLPDIAFDASCIHVLKSATGKPLDDIRSPQDNVDAADFIVELVRELTAEDDCALHASLAGGRKTMGFFLGYGMSLYGREQDRLSHVLVEQAYETLPDFYYPTPYESIIYSRDKAKSALDCSEADVVLADIHFVRLRASLHPRVLHRSASFSAAVASAQASLPSPELSVDLRNRRVRAAGRVFRLPPAELALLSWFAREAKEGNSTIVRPVRDIPDKSAGDAFLRELKKIRGTMGDTERTEIRFGSGMDGVAFDTLKSKMKAAFETALGPAARDYLPINTGRKRGFRLPLPAASIRFETIKET